MEPVPARTGTRSPASAGDRTRLLADYLNGYPRVARHRVQRHRSPAGRRPDLEAGSPSAPALGSSPACQRGASWPGPRTWAGRRPTRCWTAGKSVALSAPRAGPARRGGNFLAPGRRRASRSACLSPAVPSPEPTSATGDRRPGSPARSPSRLCPCLFPGHPAPARGAHRPGCRGCLS